MNVPSLEEAEAFLADAQARNPGPWVQHSRNVGRAAEAVAAHCAGLEPRTALVLGYLHDIGRREGVTANRHMLDGYTFLAARGFEDAAQVYLTHSFPIPDDRRLGTAVGVWDCSEEERAFARRYLEDVTYTDYDRLLQLCDCLALPSGCCTLEKRFVDVTLRYGFNAFTLPRWRAYLDLQAHFEGKTGRPLYSVLPGIVETTLGLAGTS